MKKLMVYALTAWVGVQTAWSGQELPTALQQTAAPNQEFIRTPSRYILQKLSHTANRSGHAELASFTISNELPGSEDVKVSINLSGMNLLEAIMAVAQAAGAGVEFQENRAVLKNPDEVTELVLEPPAAPEEPPQAVAADTPDKKKDSEEEDPEISFSDVSHSLVFVENGEGRGSGFIAEMDGVNYVFSNQHNFLGARRINLRTMSGTFLKPESFEYSRTHDLVRLRLEPADVTGLSVLKLSHGTPMIHDEIVIYGNSAGGGVATELAGEVIGVGPSDIEITAKMVPGNSGSPILNQKAEVIGVATYATLGQEFEKGSAYAKAFKGTRFNEVRRYGIRIPTSGWISDSMMFYLRQTYRLEDMKTYVLATYALHQYWIGDASYAGIVSRMYNSYGSIAQKGEPPFEFKMKETEELLRQVVRSFKINHDDFTARSGRQSSTQQQDAVDRMKRVLSDGVEQIKETAGKTYWKSNLLKNEAETLEAMADEIISQIQETRISTSSRKK